MDNGSGRSGVIGVARVTLANSDKNLRVFLTVTGHHYGICIIRVGFSYCDDLPLELLSPKVARWGPGGRRDPLIRTGLN